MSHTKSQVSRRKLFLCSTFPAAFSVDGNHTTVLVVDVVSSCFFVNILCWGDMKLRCVCFPPSFSSRQQRWLEDKGIYIKLSLDIMSALYIPSGETGASTYNILLINGNKKKEASAWHWAVQEILSLFVHFVLSLCFVICFGVLISAKSIIFFVVWNCVSGTKRPPPFVESTCLWLFTLSDSQIK